MGTQISDYGGGSGMATFTLVLFGLAAVVLGIAQIVIWVRRKR